MKFNSIKDKAVVVRDGAIGLAVNVKTTDVPGFVSYEGFKTAYIHKYLYDSGIVERRNVAYIGDAQYLALVKELYKLQKQAELVETTLRTIFLANKEIPAYITHQSKINEQAADNL